MADNLKIEFNFEQQTVVEADPSKIIKFLINLYDGNTYDSPEQEAREHIEFRQHEKIVAKPVNLINYFMNLMWDQSAFNKPDYLRFLSSVCTDDDRSVSIN